MMMLIIAATIGLLVQNRSDLIKSQEIRYKSYAIANELKQSSDDLTRFCRIFVMTGDTSWETKYWNVIKIRNGEMPRPDGRKIALLDSMKALGFTPEELNLLKKAEIYSNKLVWTEKVAFNALHGKFADKDSNFTISALADTNYARTIMFDHNYLEAKNKIMKPINDFLAPIDQRTNELVQYHKKEGWVILASALIVILLVNLASFISYFLVRKKLNEQLSAEAALLKSEIKYRELVENLNDVIFTTNTVGIITYVSPQVQQLYGYSPQELIGHPFTEIILPEDQQKVYGDFMSTLENKIEIREFRVTNKEGHVKWAQSTSRPIIEDGHKTGISGIFSDIDKRKRAELKVLESEKRFKAIIEQSPVAIALLDMNGHPIVSNAALSKMVGYSSEELSQMTFAEFTYPDDAEKDVSQFIALMEGKISEYNMEKRYVHKNGSLVWSNLYVTIRRDVNGLPEQIIGMAVDITEQKQAELEIIKAKEKAENSEKQIQQIANNLATGMIYQVVMLDDTNRKYTYISDSVEKFFGCSVEEALADASLIYSKTHPDDIDRLIEGERIALQNMSIFNITMRVISPEGKILWFSLTSTPRRIDGLVYWDGIVIDITELKKTEDELIVAKEKVEENFNHYKAIIESTHDFIWSVEPENFGMITFNSRLSDNFLKSRGVVVKEGLTPYEINPSQKFVQTWVDFYHRALKEGPYKIEYEGQTDSHILELNFNLIKRNDVVTAISVFGKDISEQKKAEKEIIAAKEKAEESDRLKSAFLANMSHEIRTPLNSIIGFSDLLLDPFFDEEQQVEFVQTIKNNGNNLLTIISDIMDISKIESGQMTFRKQYFSVTKLIQEIKNEQSPLIKDKNLEIRIQIPEQDIDLECDQGRVKQILMNFVNNSIKFTEKGFIEIGCNLISGFIQFYVKDTGIGISSEYYEKIFERFRQVESAHTRKYGGNGLGLTIARQLAELMGGKVGMESELGIGSTFYFSIPTTIISSFVTGTINSIK